VVFNTVTTLLFLIGESMSCLVSKARDNETGTMKQCDDVVISNATLMTWVVVFAGVQLFIFPFMKSNYTMGNLLRFDYEFREQAQITFASVALGMAIFLFASSQDGGYSDSGVSSRSARDALAWSKCARLNILCHISSFNAPFPACKIAIYAFILSAIVFHERKSNTTTTSSTLTGGVKTTGSKRDRLGPAQNAGRVHSLTLTCTHSSLVPLTSTLARRSFTHTHARFALRCVLDRGSRLRRLSEAC